MARVEITPLFCGCCPLKRRVALCTLILIALCTSWIPIHAQPPDRQVPAPSQTAPPPTSSLPAGQAEVQGYTLPPAQQAQAVAYARAEHELYFLDFIYGILLLVMFLQLRVCAALRNLAERVSRNAFVQVVVFAPLFLLSLAVLTLPTAIWGHRLSLQYQQSIQGWGSWLLDWCKGQFIEALVGVLLIWILYLVIRKSPRRWWLYFWFAAVPLIILGAVIEPLILEPMFYKFTPLRQTHPQLAAGIERLTVRAGVEIPQDRIFEMRASEKLKALNAYVSGLGATKRVVVWDTTIRRMSDDEVVFVTGHELGHYVLQHVRDGIIFSCAVLLLFLFLAFSLSHLLLARWGSAWGIRGPGDLASLPVLVLLLSVIGFLSTPLSNAYSRHLEHQADQYGLEVIHGLIPDAPVVAAPAFQVLGEVDLEEPHPSAAVKLWFYTHPPLDERMRFAQTYDPWSQGGTPEFVK